LILLAVPHFFICLAHLLFAVPSFDTAVLVSCHAAMVCVCCHFILGCSVAIWHFGQLFIVCSAAPSSTGQRFYQFLHRHQAAAPSSRLRVWHSLACPVQSTALLHNVAGAIIT
jgi:hypothetical protein